MYNNDDITERIWTDLLENSENEAKMSHHPEVISEYIGPAGGEAEIARLTSEEARAPATHPLLSITDCIVFPVVLDMFGATGCEPSRAAATPTPWLVSAFSQYFQ